MSQQITLENCPECDVTVSGQHSDTCEVELCRHCRLSRKRNNGCTCVSRYIPFMPLTFTWRGHITQSTDLFVSVSPLANQLTETSWSLLFKIRDVFHVELEVLRQQKIVGKAAETGARIEAPQNLLNMIHMFSADVQEFLGVSEVQFVVSPGYSSTFEVSVYSLKETHKECNRCRRWLTDVSVHPYWPTYELCTRCVNVLLEIKWPPYIVLNEETKDCHVCATEQEWHELKGKA